MQRIVIYDNGLAAMLYTAEGAQQQPAILLVSGSDGGMPGANAIPQAFIEYLVNNGFVVFALAYFSFEHLPQHLENIPLEYFERALQWLCARPEVDPSRIGVFGQSRGGELALLLGVHFPSLLQAIVACAPSNRVCGGFPYPNRPAWTLHGSPLVPYLPALSGSDKDVTEIADLTWAMERKSISYHANTEEDPCDLVDLFEARCQDPQSVQSEIAVEKIACPLLLLSGDEDAIWPARSFCNSIMKRIVFHRFSPLAQHINYDGAGHGLLSSRLGGIYHHGGQFWCRLGGTVAGNKKAHEESWRDVLAFFKRNLSLPY